MKRLINKQCIPCDVGHNHPIRPEEDIGGLPVVRKVLAEGQNQLKGKISKSKKMAQGHNELKEKIS